MMSFEDWRDKLLLGLIGLVMPVFIYMVVTSINSASQDYVERRIDKAMLTGPYMNDKQSIEQSIEDLYRISSKLMMDLEKARELAASNSERNYREIADIKLYLERLRMQHELYDEFVLHKKKGGGENIDSSGRIPPTPLDHPNSRE